MEIKAIVLPVVISLKLLSSVKWVEDPSDQDREDLVVPVVAASVVADSVVDSVAVALEVEAPPEAGRSILPSLLNASTSFLKAVRIVVFQNHQISILLNRHDLTEG